MRKLNAYETTMFVYKNCEHNPLYPPIQYTQTQKLSHYFKQNGSQNEFKVTTYIHYNISIYIYIYNVCICIEVTTEH